MAFSPFTHIPNVTSAAISWWGLVWISLVTLIFIVIGCVDFRRSDIAR